MVMFFDPDKMPWTPEIELIVAKTLSTGRWDASSSFDQLTFLIGARTLLGDLAAEGYLVRREPDEVMEVVDQTVRAWTENGGTS